MKKTTILTALFVLMAVFTAQSQTWDEVAKSLPTKYLNNNKDFYGRSVSIDGDYAVVGSNTYDNIGCAYVLHYDGTNWSQIAILNSSDGTEDDYFGYSVSISGNNIVVGAYQDDDNGINSGSAYVFTKPSGGWVDTIETAKLTASDGSAYDYFGYAVSISGDNIVIGAYYDDDNGTSSGSAYVFAKPSGDWVDTIETAKLTASEF